eukprot:13998969-Ditylum_brightwellii.AAC.1
MQMMMAVTNNNSNTTNQRRNNHGGRGGGWGGRGNQHYLVPQQQPPMIHPSVGMQWQQPMHQQQLQSMPILVMQQPNMLPTHGCDTPDWHTSATCPAPRQGHM